VGPDASNWAQVPLLSSINPGRKKLINAATEYKYSSLWIFTLTVHVLFAVAADGETNPTK
jgi:hypothetical protein